MKKPWITGGDNYALFLPAFTLAALVLTFVGGKVYEFIIPKKEILLRNLTSKDLDNINTSCETSVSGSAKAHSETTIISKICEDELIFQRNDSDIGRCKIPPFNYQRIEITISSIPFPVESCLFVK